MVFVLHCRFVHVDYDDVFAVKGNLVQPLHPRLEDAHLNMYTYDPADPQNGGPTFHWVGPTIAYTYISVMLPNMRKRPPNLGPETVPQKRNT